MRKSSLFLALAVALGSAAIPVATPAQVYVSLVAPPLMPSYVQPELTVPNAIWTPGYWAWGPAGYYWVPGTWTQPPSPGLYWTPGYWGMNNAGAGYLWNPGYWGQNVGYYGGVNYGYGYYGTGYAGGSWYGNAFRYNTAITRVNPQYVRNVYVNRTVVVRNVNRYSYNGPGGIRMKPNAQQVAWSHQRRITMTTVQRNHINEAKQDRNLYAKVNHGKPSETVVAKPLSTTNRPKNFQALTPADKAAANAPKPQPKPAAKPPQHAAPKPPPHSAAKPPEHTAPKPPPQSAAKPPQHAAPKPPPQSAAKPPQHTAPKPPPHSAAKPPQHTAPKPPPQSAAKPPQHAAPKPPPKSAAKPSQGGGNPPL
ncbi:MAG TPA: hypothetical protein VGF86_01050 [Candidatus Tumulicola sp.]